MASFKNLVFVTHPGIPDGIMAKYRFDNGKELSVVAGTNLYSMSKAGNRAAASNPDDVSSFEVLVGKEGDVRGWQSREDINEIFAENEV